MGLHVQWLDQEHERVLPNPAYPEGVDLDIAEGKQPACETALPYPAERSGYYLVECDACGLRMAVPAAGRPDDPRSIKVGCRQ